MINNQRLIWIDIAKGVAIIAVIVDHTVNILYTRQDIQPYSYFSVSLFLFLAGVTSAISLNRREKIDIRYLISRISPIFSVYFIATLIYQITGNNGVFSLSKFWTLLISFTASSPLYFVQYYIQLVFISPIIFNLIKKGSTFTRAIYVIILLIISIILNSYSEINGSWKLLGGTYLFIFSLGIYFHFYLDKLSSLRGLFFIFGMSIFGFFIFYQVGWIKNVISNPPNFFLTLYSLIIFLCIFSFINIFIYLFSNFSKIFWPLTYLGQNSLYIFMFHMLFLVIAINTSRGVPLLQIKWFFRVWVILWIFIAPLLIGSLISPYIDRKKQLRITGLGDWISKACDDLIKYVNKTGYFYKGVNLLLILLAFGWISRILLITNGGQLFWFDEVRFTIGVDSLNSLMKGNLNSFLQSYTQMPAHSGYYLLSGLNSLFQNQFINFFRMTGINPIFSALGFSWFSVGIILLVYLISLKTSSNPHEAFIAAFLMTMSNSMFYFSRHLLPYDPSMFFALLALFIGLGCRSTKYLILCGFLIGLSIWVYTGYWILCLFISTTLIIFKLSSIREFFSRIGLLAIGAPLPVYIITFFGWFNGISDPLANIKFFLTTATQGNFEEGWSLPWSYLWQSEHGIFVLWVAGFFLSIFFLLRNRKEINSYITIWIACLVGIYLIFVIGSVILQRFVIYGRFARELIPFFCLVCAYSICKLNIKTAKPRFLLIIGFGLVLIQAIVNFWIPLTQQWPSEIALKIKSTYGDYFRDVSIIGPDINQDYKNQLKNGSLILYNIDFLYPVKGEKPIIQGDLLIKIRHPLKFIPYQFEGFTPYERQVLQTADIDIQLIKISQ